MTSSWLKRSWARFSQQRENRTMENQQVKRRVQDLGIYEPSMNMAIPRVQLAKSATLDLMITGSGFPSLNLNHNSRYMSEGFTPVLKSTILSTFVLAITRTHCNFLTSSQEEIFSVENLVCIGYQVFQYIPYVCLGMVRRQHI